MYIHYIWIGGEIPHKYKTNVDICTKLNPGYQVILWRDQDIERLLKDCEEDIQNLYHNARNFINKYATIKYTILSRYGGVYTDLDIKWNVGFTRIQQEQNPYHKPLILTYSDYPWYTLNGESKKMIDDPFIIANTTGLMGECIKYRKVREGRERVDHITNKLHSIEPIGTLLLAEWIYSNNIECSIFDQLGYLHWSGYYGEHDAKARWEGL